MRNPMLPQAHPHGPPVRASKDSQRRHLAPQEVLHLGPDNLGERRTPRQICHRRGRGPSPRDPGRLPRRHIIYPPHCLPGDVPPRGKSHRNTLDVRRGQPGWPDRRARRPSYNREGRTDCERHDPPPRHPHRGARLTVRHPRALRDSRAAAAPRGRQERYLRVSLHLRCGVGAAVHAVLGPVGGRVMFIVQRRIEGRGRAAAQVRVEEPP